MSEEKILLKIQKLLAMASDASSPNEAMIAARKTRALMDKHQLSNDDIEVSLGTQYLEIEAEIITKKSQTWLGSLCYAVAIINDCIAISKRKDVAKYVFRGFKADAIVSKLTMDYLVECCIKFCDQSFAVGLAERNSFKLGFTNSILARAEEEKEKRNKSFTTTTGVSLIPLKESMIKNHFGQLKIREVKDKKANSLAELMAYKLGHDKGSEVNLDKQIEG